MSFLFFTLVHYIKTSFDPNKIRRSSNWSERWKICFRSSRGYRRSCGIERMENWQTKWCRTSHKNIKWEKKSFLNSTFVRSPRFFVDVIFPQSCDENRFFSFFSFFFSSPVSVYISSCWCKKSGSRYESYNNSLSPVHRCVW